MYVYTCIHVDIYTYTHRYTYIHCIHKRIYLHKKVVSWYQAKPIQNPTLHAGPGTIVPRVRWSRIPGCSFAVPRRPVNATEPRRRCHGRVAKAPTRWPSLSMPAGDGSTGQSKNTGMIYSKRYNKTCFNSSLPGQKGHNFTDDFSNEFT